MSEFSVTHNIIFGSHDFLAGCVLMSVWWTCEFSELEESDAFSHLISGLCQHQTSVQHQLSSQHHCLTFTKHHRLSVSKCNSQKSHVIVFPFPNAPTHFQHHRHLLHVDGFKSTSMAQFTFLSSVLGWLPVVWIWLTGAGQKILWVPVARSNTE